MEQSNTLKQAFSEGVYYPKLIDTILDSNTVSLREVETVIRNLEIYFYLQDGTNFDFDHKIIVITTILLHCLKPSLLQDLLNWRADAHELARFIKGGTDIKKFFPIDDITYVPTYEDLDLMVFYILLSLCRVNIKNYDEDTIDVAPEKTLREQCIESFMTPNKRFGMRGNLIDLLRKDMEKILTII
ncbi:hypothetical protein [Wielerella bovis]|uniref:hypothetical protein n=1 Tax=Wielerella bovis TaxID=2917790 RepID=UPI002018CD46|nr:hypothetical protein [Wielerella bovis]MCG7657478.1 hypothetical protein [Wielerella bovis]MCG7659699.1 hypothetical protein [Wielerella bovis]